MDNCWKLSLNYHQIPIPSASLWGISKTDKPPHDKTSKMACALSNDSDQPGHPPSLIRVFAVRMKKAWVLSYPLSARRRLWSDWADSEADPSLRWTHCHFVGFVMRQLRFLFMMRLTLTSVTQAKTLKKMEAKDSGFRALLSLNAVYIRKMLSKSVIFYMEWLFWKENERKKGNIIWQ